MTQLWHRPRGHTRDVRVDDDAPLAVWTPPEHRSPSFAGAPFQLDYLWRLALEGLVAVSADADSNDTVTGQTSFAATTPTFLLRVPLGTTAVPLFVNLGQTGSVAGGAVDVIVEVDPVVDRWSTGGTTEKAMLIRKLGQAPRCSLLSGATALAGYGARVWGATIGQDVSPAEGAVQGPYWKPELPYVLDGPASLLVFTYAGTTGPTWLWSIGWAEWPTADWLSVS